MGFLQQFTLSVVLISFFCYFVEGMMCEGALKKYTSLVVGLIVSLHVVFAFLQVCDSGITMPQIPETVLERTDTEAQDALVLKQFTAELERAVENSVFDKFKCSVEAFADVSIAEGKIHIAGIGIRNTAIDEGALKAFVEAQFGIEPMLLNGG